MAIKDDESPPSMALHNTPEMNTHHDEGSAKRSLTGRSSAGRMSSPISKEGQTVIDIDLQIDNKNPIYTDGKTLCEEEEIRKVKGERTGKKDGSKETKELLYKQEGDGVKDGVKDRITNTKQRTESQPWAAGNFFSVITAQWLTPLFRAARTRGLNDGDLYHISPEDSAEKCAKVFARLWEEEIKRNGGDAVKASLGLVMLRFLSWRIVASMLLIVLSQMVVFLLSAVSIRGLLLYAEDASAPIYRGILYAVSSMLFTAVYNVSLGAHYHIVASSGARLRGGVVTLLFQKILRLRGLHNTSMGKIVNLCVNDGNRLYDGVVYSPLIVGGPVVFICACVFTVNILGPSALIGMLIYVLSYIAQFALTGGKVIYRTRMMKETDKRVQIISEMLTNIKFIKMYAWEDCFQEKVNELRRAELRHLVGLGIVRGVQKSLNIVVPIAAVFATIMLKVFLKESLSPDEVLTFLAIIYSMRSMITMTQYGFHYLSDVLVSLPRIKNLLLQEEVLPITDSVNDRSNVIEMHSLSAAWDGCGKDSRTDEGETARDGSDVMDRESDPSLKHCGTGALNDISVAIKMGSLIGVCGSVGSGKTTLLQTILQQTHILEGSMAVAGSLAYTSQQPDIFNATLHENITMFGDDDEVEKETDDGASRVRREERYWEAIRVCCLSDDIASLPCRDRTEIGERGINLSGGQKHRVSLARAVYADRDIYLLDDPLSAVDTRVAEHIYTECITGTLTDKTVVLVTSNLKYLSKCDEVIVISNGRVIEHGTHTQLMSNDAEYARLLRTFGSDDHDKTTADDYSNRHSDDERKEDADLMADISRTTTSDECVDETKEDQLMVTETQRQGAVDTGIYLAYCRYAGGILPCLLSLLLFVLSPASAAFNNIWLSHWLSQGSGIPQNDSHLESADEADILANPKFGFYRDGYVYSFLCVFVICGLQIVYYVMITQRASFNLHRSLYAQVFSCPMQFFDTTPSGRILNRFSRDIDETDNEVTNALESALMNFLNVLSAIVIVIMVFPWFIIFVALVAIVLVFLARMYLPALRNVKRIENIKRSPFLSHVKAVVEAQSTIRAFGMEELFIQRCHNLLDTSCIPKMLFTVGQRWLAFRLDLCVAVVQLGLGLSVVYTHNTTAAAFAGLALAYSVQFLGTLQFSVRLITITQARFTSIERIIDYIDRLLPEGNTRNEQNVVEGWPEHGAIMVDSLELKYRDNLPTVLKDISFSVRSKEKIGIVGRTGSGKSSIAVALFRLVEATSGRIIIDDLDTASIRIRELRSRISVIPQDPVLFTGTLRYNLDPYDQYSDHQIWDALGQTYMKQNIAGIQQQLAVPVRENGSNFSVGERQLLCLARALLRNSKILFLDEATAAVDAETDSLVQSTIRTAFADCTVLTIAHRLHTVLDSDRILVLHDGSVLEMDTPAALLADPHSRLNALLSSGQGGGN